MGERKGRRASAPVLGEGGVQEYQASTRRGRRVVSTGMLEGLQSLVLSEEPGEMGGIKEEDEEGGEGEGEASEYSSVDDDDLPDWARRSYTGDRTHALLTALLPPDLASHLPPPGDTDKLLTVLSSGQLLCVAYNVGVRRSRKPWGYIARDAIHDIVALEAAAEGHGEGVEEKERKGGWTFRRTDNLRL